MTALRKSTTGPEVKLSTPYRSMPVGRGGPGGRTGRERRPVQVIESEPSLAARAMNLATRLTIRPACAVFSHVPHLPWPWGALEQSARVLLPAANDIRAAVKLPNATAQLIRADSVALADGTGRVILYLHGGAFLGCGDHSHGRLMDLLSKYSDAPVLAVNYRLLPKHSIGLALDDCEDGYRWLEQQGYEPHRIALAGDSAGGYLALALAQRLQRQGDEPAAAVVAMSPLLQLKARDKKAHPNAKTDPMLPGQGLRRSLCPDVTCRSKGQQRWASRRTVRTAGSYRAWPASDTDSRIRLRSIAPRRTIGCTQTGRGRHPDGNSCLAGPNPRLPNCCTPGTGGNSLIATNRRIHPSRLQRAMGAFPDGRSKYFPSYWRSARLTRCTPLQPVSTNTRPRCSTTAGSVSVQEIRGALPTAHSVPAPTVRPPRRRAWKLS